MDPVRPERGHARLHAGLLPPTPKRSCCVTSATHWATCSMTQRGAQVRIADLWIATADQDLWKGADAAAEQAARSYPDAWNLTATCSTPTLRTRSWRISSSPCGAAAVVERPRRALCGKRSPSMFRPSRPIARAVAGTRHRSAAELSALVSSIGLRCLSFQTDGLPPDVLEPPRLRSRRDRGAVPAREAQAPRWGRWGGRRAR